MLKLNDEQREAFGRSAAGVPAGAIAELAAVYAAFEQERAIRQPRCDRSGACCRFEEHGHRLFVTTIEAAAFVPDLAPRADFDGTGCPYQIDGLCGAHAVRPFGCRAYFCDRSSDEWQHQQYERFHTRIRELHERFDVPYAYVEWREALAATGRDRAGNESGDGPVGGPVRGPADGQGEVGVAPRRLALTVRPDRR